MKKMTKYEARIRCWLDKLLVCRDCGDMRRCANEETVTDCKLFMTNEWLDKLTIDERKKAEINIKNAEKFEKKNSDI